MAKTIIDDLLKEFFLSVDTMEEPWFTESLNEAKQALLKALLEAKPEKEKTTRGITQNPHNDTYWTKYAKGFNGGVDEYEAKIKSLFGETDV